MGGIVQACIKKPQELAGLRRWHHPHDSLICSPFKRELQISWVHCFLLGMLDFFSHVWLISWPSSDKQLTNKCMINKQAGEPISRSWWLECRTTGFSPQLCQKFVVHLCTGILTSLQLILPYKGWLVQGVTRGPRARKDLGAWSVRLHLSWIPDPWRIV